MRAIVFCLAMLIATGLGARQVPAGSRWAERLTALDPARPLDYFLLAEEVADAARDAEERELARTLYGLAGALDAERLARSAALGIAGLTTDGVNEERTRLRLLGLAVLLSPDEGGPAVGLFAGRGRPSGPAAVALSEAFSHLRRGQGPRALAAVRAPEPAALLERYAIRLPGGAERFREDGRAYRSGLRPAFAPGQRRAMLEIEEAVLASAGESRGRGWSSFLVETGGRPLLEVDATRIEEAFAVDPRRPWWRDGRWSATR
jgi:hypothetical protein